MAIESIGCAQNSAVATAKLDSSQMPTKPFSYAEIKSTITSPNIRRTKLKSTDLEIDSFRKFFYFDDFEPNFVIRLQKNE